MTKAAAAERTVNTLFMLMSLDGKISNGPGDDLDVDKDWKNIDGLKEGLQQYYDIEQTTDLFSLNSGKVQAKIGVNEPQALPEKTEVTFIVIDNKPHLNAHGIEFFSHLSKRTIIATTNSEYADYGFDNVDVLQYEEPLDFGDLFVRLKRDYGAEKVTIQTGGTLNGIFLREKLIDYVNIVIAPVLVGGSDTPTVADGQSITSVSELQALGVLELLECRQLENSYVNLRYRVVS
jgi:2,5-diamino-6-(ribosylamino)-4(3H)-pyrimidinone 5'-phosphate reductase